MSHQPKRARIRLRTISCALPSLRQLLFEFPRRNASLLEKKPIEVSQIIETGIHRCIANWYPLNRKALADMVNTRLINKRNQRFPRVFLKNRRNVLSLIFKNDAASDAVICP